ncbi:hypothetical protein M422DRAFT_189161, partial [Sphaerobolus stellatus SS14]
MSTPTSSKFSRITANIDSNASSTAAQKLIIGGRRFEIRQARLDMFFKWMAERDRIRRKRAAGEPFPWTKDPIMQNTKFCNVFRIHDRGTQYLLNEVINKGDQDFREIAFRVILFKCFMRTETWEALCKGLGPLKWSTFNLKRYGAVLGKAYESGPLYTGAYQIPPPKLGYPKARSYMNHLRLVQMMMKDDVPGQLLKLKHLQDAYNLIQEYPGMGPFLSYQLILDLNNIPQLNFPENEWVSYGPGSLKCLQLIFVQSITGLEFEAMQYLYSSQDEHFARLGITDPPCVEAGKPGVGLVDIEHALCEASKYYHKSGRGADWKP